MIEDSISIKTNEEKTVLPEEGGKYIIIVEQIDSIKYYLQNAKGNNPKNEIKIIFFEFKFVFSYPKNR